MPRGPNDEVSLSLTVAETNQWIMLAQEGAKALIGKVVRQFNEQMNDDEHRPHPMRPVAAE